MLEKFKKDVKYKMLDMDELFEAIKDGKISSVDFETIMSEYDFEVRQEAYYDAHKICLK